VINAIRTGSHLLPAAPADAIVPKRMRAHRAAGEGPLAGDRAGPTGRSSCRRWNSRSLESGKGRRVVALIDLSASPIPFGSDASRFLSGAGLIPVHGELEPERLADPLHPWPIGPYRVDFSEEIVGQTKQYSSHTIDGTAWRESISGLQWKVRKSVEVLVPLIRRPP
jgi:hypothetical protein